MNLTLDRDAALAATARAAGICARTNTIPILGHVVIEAADGRVRFRASNLEAEIASTVDATVAEAGETAVPAHTLFDILKNAAAGSDVTITTGAADPRAIVKSGRSTFKLPVASPDLLPIFAILGAKIEAAGIGNAAALALATVAHAASREEIRPGLMAVCLMASGGKLRAYATNQQRAAAAEDDIGGADEWQCMLLPRAAEQIAQLAEDAPDLSLQLTESLIIATAGDVRYASKLLDCGSPNYERAFATELPYTVSVGRAELLQAVRRALIVNTDKDRGVRLDFTSEGLTVSTRKPMGGEATDEIEATFDGPATYVMINGGYLVDALTRISGASITIRVGSNRLPIIITDPADARARFMIGVQHG